MSNSIEQRFRFRSPRLYEGIVRLSLEDPAEGVGWAGLLGRVDPENEWAERTIEGAIRDLVVFGICSIKGQPGRGRRPEGRRVVVTPAGLGVLDGKRVPIPWDRPGG